MTSRIAASLAAASLALLALTACAPTNSEAPAAESSTAPNTSASSEVALSTADSSIGTIVVDGTGKAVYQFDNDTQNGDSSSCTGQCAANWPAVPGSDAPKLDGVTGEVGTITGVDGEPQLTLNGWPLYYYVGDNAAGDTYGQGLQGIWWVLTPAGKPITSDTSGY
ncbi:Predicted lipoprotein with conserved Yx(FWY)xxD motif [Paramicrobacterium humi]|uniref:Predicted lipoprotein with conserved Yx(FWY)xxD motif n=1 Tax=Paramicrobacterium humi TaxID=640635 RepID=A0A1H4KRP4_9MICO|nr:hypothetical protein [Microbacterium humi]SEB61177.1 Predicted lipoprotein with conserved Yx(FWY)xxD motif [Microbacterium humi]